MAIRTGFCALLLATGVIVACGARTDLDGDNPVHDAGDAVVDGAPRDVSIDASVGLVDATSPHLDASARDAARDAAVDAAADAARVDAGMVDASVFDAGSVDAGDVSPPRLRAPLSSSTATSQRPTLRWVLPAGADGAEVSICRDRACATLVARFRALGESARVPVTLTRGTYFWHARGTAGARVGTATSATWELAVGKHDASVDTSWGSTVDPNGDGHADLVVAAPFLTGLTGAVQVFLGNANGALGAPYTFTGGDPPFPEIGYSVASAGDVNGDGFAEILFAAPNSGGAAPGAVYLYAGGSGFPLPAGPQKISGPGAPNQFGHSVASVGDVNGDGYGDVAMAATSSNTFGGGVFLYLGSANGLVAPSGVFDVARLPVVASAGDVDGDGYGDIAIGDVAASRMDGAVRVYRGSATGLVTPPTTLLVTGPYSFTGYAVAGGDVNGDGYSDVVVGAPGRTPRVAIFGGGPSGIATAPFATIADPSAGPNNLSIPNVNFGSAVAVAGDVDDDGVADVAIGASAVSRAYVARGGASLGSAPPIEIFRPGVTSLALAVAGGGDLDADGVDDLLIGAPYTDSGVGRAFVYFGGAAFPSSSTSLVGPGARGSFGFSLAGRPVVPLRRSSGRCNMQRFEL